MIPFTEEEIAKITRMISFKTRLFENYHDREDVRQEAWIWIIQYHSKYYKTNLTQPQTFAKWAVKKTVYEFIRMESKRGFTFNPCVWTKTYGDDGEPKRDPRNQVPVGGTKRCPRPAGTQVSFSDYEHNLQAPGFRERKVFAAEEY